MEGPRFPEESLVALASPRLAPACRAWRWPLQACCAGLPGGWRDLGSIAEAGLMWLSNPWLLFSVGARGAVGIFALPEFKRFSIVCSDRRWRKPARGQRGRQQGFGLGGDVKGPVLRNRAGTRALSECKEMAQARFRMWRLVERGHVLPGLKSVSLSLGRKKLYRNLLREEAFATPCTVWQAWWAA